MSKREREREREESKLPRDEVRHMRARGGWKKLEIDFGLTAAASKMW